MKKSLILSLLMGVTMARGMEVVSQEQWGQLMRLLQYGLSLDWCENQLGFAAQQISTAFSEEKLAKRYKEIGCDCGRHTGKIVQGTCIGSALCCAAFTCMECPCVGACGCAAGGLVVRKLYSKYGLAKKSQ